MTIILISSSSISEQRRIPTIDPRPSAMRQGLPPQLRLRNMLRFPSMLPMRTTGRVPSLDKEPIVNEFSWCLEPDLKKSNFLTQISLVYGVMT